MKKLLLKILLFPLNAIHFLLTLVLLFIIMICNLIGELINEAVNFFKYNNILEIIINTTAAKMLVKLGISRIGEYIGYKKFDEKYLVAHWNAINFTTLYKLQAMSEDFVKAFKEKYTKTDWVQVSVSQKLSKKFIMDNSANLHFGRLLVNPFVKKLMKDDKELELFIRLKQ